MSQQEPLGEPVVSGSEAGVLDTRRGYSLLKQPRTRSQASGVLCGFCFVVFSFGGSVRFGLVFHPGFCLSLFLWTLNS